MDRSMLLLRMLITTAIPIADGCVLTLGGPGEEVPSHFEVGGGTRFAPVFNWINRQNDTPDFCIMFTDLGSHFEEEPEYPVLWASTVPIWEGINEPPFGEAVEIEL